ncbi:AAA family ATPase [Haladaptatus sp. NG-WS-4]
MGPISVFLVADKLSSTFGIVITVIASIISIWFLPGLATSIIFAVITRLGRLDDETVDASWFFGMMIGIAVLTGIWFLPLWGDFVPGSVTILQPFRVSPMFDNPWLMGLSWVVCIPIPVFATLSTLDNQDKENSSKKEKEQIQSTSSETNQNHTIQDRQHRDESHSGGQSDLTYDWESAPTTRFRDVGGMDSLKRNVMRSVLRPLSHTDAAYERFNVSPPNGILLHGPPGTGKTHFARAIAGELGHPYLELSAGDIKSRWVNESTEQVNQLFNEAEQFDRCVIFVDEIDALLAGRGNDLHREHAQVVNEFLAHLDDEDPSFLLIAATNRADLLDEAATRRGRFDQQYEVGLPDQEAREKIFKVRLQTLPTELDQEEYQKLAERSTELSSADIVGIVDDAAMKAAERDAQAITYDDLAESFPESTTAG